MRTGQGSVSRLFAAMLALAVAAGLVIGIAPAFAAHTNGTASVDVRDVIAGTASRSFTMRVNHDAGVNPGLLPGQPGTPAINYILITTPANFPLQGATSLPSGWNARVIPSPVGIPRTLELTGGTIAHNSFANFTLNADVPTPGQDTQGTWKVEVSDDGGATLKVSGASSSGALTTTVRVLAGQVVSILSPAGATDGSVTQDQGGVVTRCSIRNFGSATRNVTASLSGNQITVEQAPAAKNIAPGATETFDFTLRFGNPANTTATCSGQDGTVASTGPFTATLGIAIQAKRIVSYVANSLTPRAINPISNPSIVFRLRVNIAGIPAVSINRNQTTFSFAGLSTRLASPLSVPQGAVSNFELEFDPLTIPASLGNGSFSTRLDFEGLDANDAPVVFRPVPGTEDIKLDALAPNVDPTLIPPLSQVPGEEDAVKNGDLLRFGGTVTDTNPATGEEEPCGACTIVDSYLEQFDGLNGGSMVGSPVQVNVTNSGGSLGGQYTGGYHADAQSVQLVVHVVDEAGNPNSNRANLVQVDNIAPRIVQATTRRTTAGAQNTLLVTLNECVVGMSNATDWSVDGNLITSAGPVQCPSQPGGQAHVVLTALQDFPDDATGGVLTYAPGSLSTRYRDRVGLTMANQDVNLTDGIPPLQPLIQQVQGMPLQDGKFWTNQRQTVVTVTNPPGSGERAVRAGYRIVIFDDGGNELGSATAQGPSVNVSIDLGTRPEGEYGLEAISFDTATVPNPSEPATAVLELDLTRPGISEIQTLGDRIVVTFSESVPRGRDFAADWQVFDINTDKVSVASVTGSGTSRTLNISDPIYMPANVASVSYFYLGPDGSCPFTGTQSCRYEDRATNAMLDRVFTL